MESTSLSNNATTLRAEGSAVHVAEWHSLNRHLVQISILEGLLHLRYCTRSILSKAHWIFTSRGQWAWHIHTTFMLSREETEA